MDGTAECFCEKDFVLFSYASRYDKSLQDCFQIILVSNTAYAVWKVRCLQMCLDVPNNVGLVLQGDCPGGTQIEFQQVGEELGKTW